MKEMQKLVLFKSESSSKIINKEDIDQICVLGLSYNIFDLIEKIVNDEKREALEAMDKIFKFESSPAILLISLWYTHFENLLYLKTYEGDSLNTEIIKLPPSVVDKKLRPQAKKLNVDKILESLNFLTSIDHGLRNGSFDLRFYLEQFILKF
jgi:DNA polymerase III delta subunit